MQQSPTILIVDDIFENVSTLFHFLDNHQFEILVARDGESAIELLDEEHPDLILLDLMMPEMDGFEFTMRLRDNEKWRTIPIIVLTAKDITSEDRLALNNYVQNVFQKGHYQKDKLLLEIRELLNKNPLPTLDNESQT